MNISKKIEVIQAAINRPCGAGFTWGDILLIATDVATSLNLKIGFNGPNTQPGTFDVHLKPRGGRDFGRQVGAVKLPAELRNI